MTETSKTKLSICIPTLNRGPFIGETLESIIFQATDQVEIVIVDGGSTDNTQEVVAQFQKRFPRLRYFREDAKKVGSNSPSPSGAGFDRDCNRAVELAVGEYCWLFTDDDLLGPGAIQTVLNATQQQYALIIVNAEVLSSDLSQSLEHARLRLTSDRVYKPEENQTLFTDVANYLSFVGGVVIKRQLWLAREKEQYIGTGFIHIGVLFQSPMSEPTLVIHEPLVRIRFGDAHYMHSSRYFEIWMFIWPNLIWSFAHLSDAAKALVCRKEPWRRIRTLLLHRARGTYTMNTYLEWLEPRLESFRTRAASKAIAYLPRRIANLLAVAYFSALGQRFALYSLTNSPFYVGRLRKRRPAASERQLAISYPPEPRRDNL